jgi:hypothetical protein
MSKSSNGAVCIAILAVFGVVRCAAQAQNGKKGYPDRLPYAFSDFVWWSDDELRRLLKERIGDLGDEIGPGGPTQDRIRDTLTALLRSKGVTADVMSEEPSYSAFSGARDPDAPGPSIVFSILSPKVVVDKVVISQAPYGLTAALNDKFSPWEGKEYSSQGDWFARSQAREVLHRNGYLDAQVEVGHDAPRQVGDRYAVNLLVTVTAGQQYRIGSITADGGPLLEGRDLSPLFSERVGEVAGAGPFGRLAGEVRAYYAHFGYADVVIVGPPVLDHEHAMVSYHLTVTPGPLYHLRSLAIHGLDSERETKVRALLGMNVGGVFDEMAIDNLYHKIADDPALASYSFSFGPRKDANTGSVDLTLDFFKTGNEGDVTIK